MKLRRKRRAGKVALAYSGGLDSLLSAKLLTECYDADEIIAVLVDVGQGGEDIQTAREKLRRVDAQVLVVDARAEYMDEWVSQAIRANGTYCGYPLFTAMSRQLIARKVIEIAVEYACDAVAEGSTGKGNDQFRFHSVFRSVAPSLRIITPIRDFNLSRPAERQLATEFGLEYYPGISDDNTAWGRSVGSGEISSLDGHVDAAEFRWWHTPATASDNASLHEIEFQQGVPVRIDGIRGMPEVIARLNITGGLNGIGLIDIIEDGIMGLKSREIYEAPAAAILLGLHRDLEQLCLTKEELEFKSLVDRQWSHLVYHGKAFHPLKAALDDFISRTQQFVDGVVTIELYKGNVRILRRESESGLFGGHLRTVERESFDQRAMESVIEAFTISSRSLHRRSSERSVSALAPERIGGKG